MEGMLKIFEVEEIQVFSINANGKLEEEIKVLRRDKDLILSHRF